MSLSFLNRRALVFAAVIAICLGLLEMGAGAGAQDKRFPERAGHVNDLAEAIDPGTKQRLETVLNNLQQKTDVDFVIATVKSIGDEDIYDYSLRLAIEWKVGIPTAPGKNLLLIVVADGGKIFTQVTPAGRLYLPEGLIGDMGRRIRDRIDVAGISSGLVSGVRTFIDRTGELHNFDFASMDPQGGEKLIAERQRPRVVRPLAESPSENPQPTPTATPATESVATITPASETPSPATSPTAAPAPSAEASETPAPAASMPTPIAPVTETPAPSPQASETPNATPTATPVESSTPQPSPSETPNPTTTAVESPTPQPSPSETPTPVETPSATPAETPAVQPSPVASPESTQTIAANTARPGKSPDPKLVTTPADPEDEKEEVELTLTKPLDERIQLLKDFIATHPTSVAVPRANELLVMARALLADRKMEAGDPEGGLQLFRAAISEAPIDMPDRLFVEVIARIPLNLFYRSQRDAAFEAAHQAEALAKSNEKRLLALAQFYLTIENAAEAARIAESVVQLAPDSSAAHLALGAARRIALRPDDAETEFARALALDPKSSVARLALADLKRGGGKAEEALALYRDQIQADPKSDQARVGAILSLLELGKKDEAEAELSAALQDKDRSRSLALLVGTSYWFTAHNDAARGLDLAERAVAIEPRYSWAQIAYARALVANKRPLEAERALRFVLQYSRFPTLDYELATVLASIGLYDEAMAQLQKSFSVKNGDIETKLNGSVAAHAASFLELLAPERRAAIFQATAADTEANAKMMKALLTFNAALDQSTPNENDVLAAAQDFTSGDDAMRTYRQIYVGRRLVKTGVALSSVIDFMDQATSGVDAALDVPAATVAVQPEELSDVRARALAQGGTPDIPDAPRTALAGILRGRIEDIAGLAFFNMDKPTEAATRLRRAVATATEGTPLWIAALWHLGAALEAGGKNDQALLYYIKSYVSGGPDPARRSVIENVYKKVNGTLDGLDDKIGPGFAATTATPSPTPETIPSPTPETTPTPTPPPESSPSPSPTPTPTPEATPTPDATATPAPTPEASPTPSPTATPIQQ